MNALLSCAVPTRAIGCTVISAAAFRAPSQCLRRLLVFFFCVFLTGRNLDAALPQQAAQRTSLSATVSRRFNHVTSVWLCGCSLNIRAAPRRAQIARPVCALTFGAGRRTKKAGKAGEHVRALETQCVAPKTNAKTSK